MTAVSAADAEAEARKAGLVAALVAYSLWGLSVIFYKWLAHVPADEVIAHRVVWTVVFVGLFLAYKSRLGEVRAAFRDRAVMARLFVTAMIIGVNWLIFVWAIANNEVLAVSFGYFINPLVSVLLGFILLGERLSRAQAIAIGLAVVAVAIQAATLVGFPWISLFLAFSFAVYGYIRKMTPVSATPGLFVETTLIVPLGIVYVIYLEASGNSHFEASATNAVLLMMAGVVTSVPLILFAYAARRLTLTTVGLLQYLAPSIHFLLAVLIYGEALSMERLASFVLIWIALAIFSYASWRAHHDAGGPAPA